MSISNNKAIAYLCSLLIIISLVHLYPDKTAQSQEAEPWSEQEDLMVYLPLIQNNFDSTLGTPIFGVQMYGSTTANSAYYPYLIESGSSWLRVPVSWQSVEPVEFNPAQYNWATVDAALGAAFTDNNIQIIATIDTAPVWARVFADSPRGPVKATNLGQFAAFVRAMAERYDGDGVDDAPGSPVVTYWEIYNEPDSGSGISSAIGWGNYGAEYATMLSHLYPAIKSANPQAKVALGGLAYDWFEENGGPFVRTFLNDVLSAGGGAYFDIMNFHYYPSFGPNWTNSKGPGLREKTAAVRTVLSQYGLQKPMIITEAGWHDNSDSIRPSTPEKQARYVVQLFVQSLASDVDMMIWWMLYDAGGDYPFDTGLVTNDSVPVKKLAFSTYQNLVTELSTAHYIRTLSAAETGNEDIETFQFQDNTQNLTIYVAWLDPIDTTSSAPLRLPASQAVVRNSLTNSTYTVRDADDGSIDGKIIIAVSNTPMYVEIAR